MMFRLVLFVGVFCVLQTAPVTAQVSADNRLQLLERAVVLMDTDAEAAHTMFVSVTVDEYDHEIVDSLSGVAYHKMGLLAYRAQEDSLAAAYYSRAIAVRDSVFRRPHAERAASRGNLAICQGYLDQPKLALQTAREATAIYAALPEADTNSWVLALVAVASTALELQDYQLARSATYRSVDMVRQGEVRDAIAFSTYYQGAEILLRFGELDLSLDYATKALEYARRQQRPDRIIKVYNQLAITNHQLGETESELNYLLKAIAVANETQADTVTLASLYLNLADYHGERGDYDKSQQYDRMARQLYQGQDALREYASAAEHPLHLFEMGHLEEALALIEEKLGLLDLTGLSTDPPAWAYNYPSLVVPCIDLLSVRADALVATTRHDEALADYATVVELLDHLRTNVTTFDSRSYLSKNLRPFFDRATELYYRAYQRDGDQEQLWKAFELSERARAFSLLSDLRLNQSRTTPQIKSLNKQIARLERRVARGELQYRAELENARLILDRQRQLVAGIDRPPPKLDRARLVDHLATNNIRLLEYAFGPELGLVFEIDGQGNIAAYPIPAIDSLNERINRWRTAIEEGYYRRKSLRDRTIQDAFDATFLRGGGLLTRQLLPEPLLRKLEQSKTDGSLPRLCIIPDGGLHYLPFAALPLSQGALPLEYGSLKYLQDRAELQYAYSATVLLEITAREEGRYATDLVAFAPTFVPNGSPLSPLVHNKSEVDGLRHLLPQAIIHTGGAATRARFEAEVGQSAILHLSSHGSVHPRDAQLSFIAFTQSGDSLDREELLYFNDLGHLIIDNELTVLSACETSLGELVTGETTLSFASALATAGSRSTVTTLWKVDDGATKELLLTFYRQLLEGDGRSNALSRAQAELRHHADFAHPYYWSGIVLYGKAGPLPKALIKYDSWTNQLGISLLGMLLLAAGGGLSYLWRRKELVI